jgi:hypothetical protein
MAACTTPVRRVAPVPTPMPAAAPASGAALAASIAAAAQRSEHEPDARARSLLAEAARRDAEACIQEEPEAAACLFGRGVALGLEAKAHPTRATNLLSDMLATLARAEAADPYYDDAGPARVQALVLIRAPGWPLGPGDPEHGLAAALRAAALRPAYPPNLLALAEAQSKMGAVGDARATYERARDAAGKLPESADRADWLREAELGLRHTP